MSDAQELPSVSNPVPSAEALRLAEAALDEIAPAGAVGEIVDAVDEHGVLALRYRSALDGYPDWLWTVTLAGDEGAQTVLEVALLPGASSLVAPDWVPWADRLAEYLAAKAADEADAGETDEESDHDADGTDEFGDFDEDDLVADDADDDGLSPDEVGADADEASDADEVADRG